MRVGTLTLLVLALIANPFLAHGESCGLIDNWNEQDAKSLYSDYETWGTNRFSEERGYSSLVMSALKSFANDYKWRLSIILFSFSDMASAEAFYDKMKSDWDVMWGPYGDRTIYPDNSNDLVSMIPGPDNLGGDKAKRFFLMGKHLGTFVFSLNTWSTTPFDSDGLDISQLRSEALSIFEKAKFVVNSKCGLGTDPPKISFYPYDPNGYLLELSIVKDKGFLIEIEDEDGVNDSRGNWKIDWGTFQVLLEGHDITAHFLKTIVEQGLLTKAAVINVGGTFQALIKLDPTKLMNDHNVFAIAENGRASITLKICDVDGLCGSTEHQIYFGPFMVVSKAEIQGPELGIEADSVILIRDVFIGNTGRHCRPECYLAVLNEGNGTICTRNDDHDWVLYQNQNDLKPWMHFEWETGSYARLWERIPLDWPRHFEGGNLFLIVGILDKTTNEWALDSTQIKGPE